MIDAVIMARFFRGGDVGWLLDNADELLVASRTAAIDTRIDVGNVVADGAQTQFLFEVTNGGGEGFGVIGAGTENVKGEALRAFVADAGQLLQFVDEPRHRFGKLR